MIGGVKIKKLRVIPDQRGRLMEILRNDEDLFQKFGQVYMTTTYPGVVKAWYKHEKQADNIACVAGMTGSTRTNSVSTPMTTTSLTSGREKTGRSFRQAASANKMRASRGNSRF